METVRLSECWHLLINTFLPWKLICTWIQITFRRQKSTFAIQQRDLDGYIRVEVYLPCGQAWLLSDQRPFWLIHSFYSCIHFFKWSWCLTIGQEPIGSLQGDFCTACTVPWYVYVFTVLLWEHHAVTYFQALWQKLSVECGFHPHGYGVHPACEVKLPFKDVGKGLLSSGRTFGPEA